MKNSDINFTPCSPPSSLQISDNTLGYLDGIAVVDGKYTHCNGWGLIKPLSESGQYAAPRRFVLVCNGNVIGSCCPNVSRPDLQSIYPGAPDVAGFSTYVPLNLVKGNPYTALAVYIEEAEGVWGEMHGPDGLLPPLHPAQTPALAGNDGELLLMNKCNGVAVALTSKCNLRCSYCCINDENYPFGDMPDFMRENIAEQAVQLGVREICLGLSGEPTYSEKFVPFSKELQKTNIFLSCTTNFARIFSHEEIATFAHYGVIEVSVDTLSSEHMKIVRKPAKIEIIIYNIIKIQTYAASHEIPPPRFVFNIVINNITVFDLEELAHAADILGVENVELFYMRRPTENFSFDGPVQPLDACQDKSGLFVDAMRKSMLVFQKYGIEVSVEKELAKYIVETDMLATGNETSRCCLHPWTHMMILHDGTTYCCPFIRVGLFSKDTSLHDIFTSPRIQRVRSGLIKGSLVDTCRTCSLAFSCSPDTLKAAVREYGQTRKWANSNLKPKGFAMQSNAAFGAPLHYVI